MSREELERLFTEDGRAAVERLFTEDEYGSGDDRCTWCGGDIWIECDDPIQCCSPRCDGELHPCTARAGTGQSKHQAIW